MIDGELVEFVRDLKQQPGGDIGVHGSISVAQALLAADLVDELRLAIGPMIAGRGRRLLDGLPSMQLESIRSEISPTGYLLVDYRVVRSAARQRSGASVQAAPGHERSNERNDHGRRGNREEDGRETPAAIDPGRRRPDRGGDDHEWSHGVSERSRRGPRVLPWRADDRGRVTLADLGR